MSSKNRLQPSYGVLFGLLVLAGCGGGSASGNSGSGSTVSTYTPSATVLAAKATNYATPFWAVLDPATLAPGAIYGANGTCSGIDMSTTVYVLPNTITYAAKGVSDLSQQQVAEYAEKAITEIKSTLGLPSGMGFAGQPIQICTQTPLIFGSAQGIADKKSFRVTSTDSASLDKGYLSNDYDLYKKLIKHELVHTYHNATLGTDDAVLDTWFAEGFAEYIASGKSSKSKTEIMNMVNTQNPIAVMTSGMGTGNLTYYPAFQSSVAYLFDANGAKNSLTMIPAFMDALKTNYTNASLTCAAAGTCATFRETVFTQTFEANFKEADGTGMKLRTGTNNLQSTIATRLTNFLQ